MLWNAVKIQRPSRFTATSVWIELRDGRLDDLPDGTFDLIAMYSVLHHIPDYVASITDLLAKLKPGGVMLIEHERHPHHYFPTPELQAFRRENHDATRGGLWDPEHKRWQYLLRAALTPSRHIARWRKYRGVYAEGDIHVRADDHIEWDRIVVALTAHGAEIVAREDHLLYVEGYDRATWERWADRCVDQTALIARRA